MAPCTRRDSPSLLDLPSFHRNDSGRTGIGALNVVIVVVVFFRHGYQYWNKYTGTGLFAVVKLGAPNDDRRSSPSVRLSERVIFCRVRRISLGYRPSR
jgi:hypothetical protein